MHTDLEIKMNSGVIAHRSSRPILPYSPPRTYDEEARQSFGG